MPRPKKAVATAPVIPSNSLVASAARFTGRMPRIYQGKKEWQRECYRHYAICGEARFAARFYGHALSRASLSVAQISGDGTVKRTNQGPAADVFAELFNGASGQKQMLELIGLHFAIAGECYLVGREIADDEGNTISVWEIISVLEVEVTGDRWTIKYSDGRPDAVLTDDDVVIRLWMADPSDRLCADSPFKALLPILAEIEWLTRHIYAQITSRLAGNGILFLPQEMTFPPPPAQDGKEVETSNQAEAFMVTLGDAMMESLKDPGLPSSKIPIVVQTAGEMIDKPRWMQFWSELDANSQSLRAEAIRRFALGMDLPPEQVLGMASNMGTGGGNSNGVSHWGAWQIEEATIKMHIEPMLDTVVNGLVVGYLRPAINGDPQWTIVYDTSALRLRPDRSKEALELFDRGLVSGAVVVRENGFNPEDMPSPEEFRRWLTVKVATGSATPEQMQAALEALGVHLNVAAPVNGEGREQPADPSLLDHPERPKTPDSALLAASEALVFRALERAGNRLRSKGQAPVGVPSYETHCFVMANGTAAAVMEDAWPTARQVLDGIADADKVIPVLDSYCKTLLAEQAKHDRDRLAHWLTEMV
jgi:hypothetical protein